MSPGFSAGAAAAAIMGAAYPDLYAAIGVHSGLACGAASDLPSAFAAMRQGSGGMRTSWPAPRRSKARRIVPTIVFHGDRTPPCNPRNGDAVIAQSRAAVSLTRTRCEEGQVPGGHAYSRTLHADDERRARCSSNGSIHGAGHAWSGGSPAGSYTDPRGPDATRRDAALLPRASAFANRRGTVIVPPDDAAALRERIFGPEPRRHG